MTTSISVNKVSVQDLLKSGKEHKFIIPEYQRPYAWGVEEAETLFNDLWDFTEKQESTYFLGSIVSYLNEQGEQEIIDGQQRITSLFLLLRAIYTNLQQPEEKTKEAMNFIQKIEPTIWIEDSISGDIDYSKILIESKVINNAGNEILRRILETGKADENATDNYSVNYRKFQELYNNKAQQNPMQIYYFILAVLSKAILLPITADTQDTALTIFSTLNDRGLPLSDADIFKAKIYNHLNSEEKNKFIEEWKELDENAQYAGETIQSLFYYYMFYLRAKSEDDKSTTPGIRKYFSDNKYARLFAPELLSDLSKILNIWKVVNKRDTIDNEEWSQNTKILQALDILSAYPNEFWKYPVLTYYLSHNQDADFTNNFLAFLHKLIVELLTKYLITPTINAVKTDIMKLNVEIIKTAKPKFIFKDIDRGLLETNIKAPNGKTVRMLLKLIAYKYQDTLLPEKWEIEHIFPQKWHNNYFSNISDDIIKEKIEYLGNKVPFEKKLNIQAGNGYFSKKQQEYAQSSIKIVKELANKSKYHNDWNLDNITERGMKVCEDVLSTVDEWNAEYIGMTAENTPTPEDLAAIEKYKLKGWI